MRSVRVFHHYMRLPLLLLAGAEAVLFAACYYIGFHTRWLSINAGPVPESASPLLLSGLVAIVFVIWMAAMGLYEAHLREGLHGSLIRVVLALLLGSVTLAAISFAMPELPLWRSTLLLAVIFSFIAILLLRGGFYFFRPNFFKRRILVVGSIDLTQMVIDTDSRGIDFVGFLPLETEADAPCSVPIIHCDEPLPFLAARLQVDAIVLALPDCRGKLPIEELLDCKVSGIDILELQSFFEREVGIIKLDLLSPSWLVYSDGFSHGSISLAVKRLFDLVMATILGLIFAPFMLVAALAIFIESDFRYSVLYRQVRIGENGMPFQVIKFRSMRIDAEADGRPRWATKHDDRVTRVGRFIRKTRIDEMPQIFNIIKGDMSFVGPRPERPEFVTMLAKKHIYYASRHRVKPGLTGWAQLCFPYGNTEADALSKLEYDLYYVKNYSLFLDMLILVETVEVVLFGKGAL
ncbi:TIGR03013 family PEP-CTERM/XrtA system glycosyltransferase [Rhodoferax sp. 4810]|uniref:TIGR03013 family PEP-CTERM/XrtA system glycosyltransferase n=1 Tax=Thiospirillum jenense TaxID=1653858 RepID=A0A839H4M4_9GAMM|nr:TIGR03013 family XrtA/PEP-CTERM system glycosyltransferase [Thiospirillum jenense]MBB1073155.1 TIGR03013 family PEP-CTERM/XrtA system glycosyltransferase [Rhodoferax jenense]MBB1124684.1 TIGR03013 family PEP-CTERM/XrtA system glycosyltransferase [Thiospirillum jenense]